MRSGSRVGAGGLCTLAFRAVPHHLVSSVYRPPAACAMPEHLHSATPREAPKFPVINAEPTAGAVIANYALYDYGRMAFVMTLGAAWGFAGGGSC